MRHIDLNLSLATPHQELHGVVFIEANPFASRLHVLEPMVNGADASRVWIVGPARATGPDVDTFIRNLGHHATYLPIQVGSDQSAESRITARLLMRLLIEARRLLRPYGRRTLVLTAIDDYFLALPWISIALRVLFPNTRIVAIRYRVADLLSDEKLNLTQRLKTAFIKVLQILVSPENAIFDERVGSAPSLHVLPDPWTGPFGELTRMEARRRLNWAEGDEVVLLIGGQDERKGFDVAVSALLLLKDQRPDVRIVLVGRVVPPLQKGLDDLVRTFGDGFVHIPQYLSDEEISIYFSAASTVLLPYHTAFTSTSGVLVRAAASSTPVVASDHGLVGWRTTIHSLGRTFRYPNHQELSSKIVATLEHKFDPTKAQAFARGSTQRALSQAFGRIIND